MDPSKEPSTHPSDFERMRDPANKAASEAFFDRYKELLGTLCRAECRVPGEVEELTQDVIVKLFAKLRQFRYNPELRFRGWLRMLIRNEARDQLRHRRRHPGDHGGGGSTAQGLLGEIPDSRGASVEAGYLELEDRLERERLLGVACERVRPRVSGLRWRAFCLTAIEGRRGVEVAAELGINIGAVHAATHHVTKLIRAEVDRLCRPREAG
jgi:RNA polymerase sigma factor (sigma-70 family)